MHNIGLLKLFSNCGHAYEKHKKTNKHIHLNNEMYLDEKAKQHLLPYQTRVVVMIWSDGFCLSLNQNESYFMIRFIGNSRMDQFKILTGNKSKIRVDKFVKIETLIHFNFNDMFKNALAAVYHGARYCMPFKQTKSLGQKDLLNFNERRSEEMNRVLMS